MRRVKTFECHAVGSRDQAVVCVSLIRQSANYTHILSFSFFLSTSLSLFHPYNVATNIGLEGASCNVVASSRIVTTVIVLERSLVERDSFYFYLPLFSFFLFLLLSSWDVPGPFVL